MVAGDRRAKLGQTTGMIGTIEIRAGHRVVPSTLTTPESTQLHALMALMRQEDVASAVMYLGGTGSAGMEFCFVNLIEPGDEVIVGVNGVFGTRMADVAARCGANVTKVEAPWGRIIEAQQIAEALKGKRPKLVAIVHAETSGDRCEQLLQGSGRVHPRLHGRRDVRFGLLHERTVQQ